ncbi:BON domain-containing protein [Methylicorpusculum sp.]|uniref:BON domain-containing protein n=1 Tax=Methylicorpusculum sp. TaxID=2713644 RepID=UPI00272F31CB|nr:BON domain-containing protein [Methylicorpusculum sp.]MDP2177721.1 BON domain-containing protein [Methylicorpusculum sp.]MDP3528310.1 BON domain-containing protein [Methylicorpusculum sp.]MDZ4149504.1 BON domain-containing protein [Methylicorpusculum sp.]
MFKQSTLVVVTLTAGLLMMTSPIQAESALENSEINVRDKDNATLTPEDQKETEGDIAITAAIRQAVVKDESLSVNAQNIKIITRNGVVTLRGPVETEAESIKLQKIAEETSGVVKVDNQLENKAP